MFLVDSLWIGKEWTYPVVMEITLNTICSTPAVIFKIIDPTVSVIATIIIVMTAIAVITIIITT